MVLWKVVLMVQDRHNKTLTLGAAHAARLCGEDALLDGVRCTCLYRYIYIYVCQVHPQIAAISGFP